MYDEYVSKIKKAVAVRNKIYRFRILLITATATTLIATASLVSTRGVVTDAATLSLTYTYGDPLVYHSAAFLGEVEYEFSPLQEEKWSSEQPRLPGHYRMRSKSANNFSSYYYGKEQVFEIVPKPIVATAKEDSLLYGETASLDLSDQLVAGDTLLPTYTFDYGDKSKAEWNVTPLLSSLSIQSSSGSDVTSCYSVQVTSKLMPISKRALTIKTSSASKTYDGTALTSSEYEVLSGSLAEGDHLQVSHKTAQISSGSNVNHLAFQILGPDASDRTSHYAITEQAGTLEIAKKKLSLQSADHTATYDGTNKAPTLDDIALADNTSLIDGESISYEFTCPETMIAAGTYASSFKATIKSGEEDVTDNYDITYTFGTITINKRSLTLQADSAQKTYDGDSLTTASYRISEGSLAATDEIVDVKASPFTAAGDYDNQLTLDIVNKTSQKSCLSSYDLTNKPGAVSIAKRDVDLALQPVDIVYDGLPHQNPYQIATGSLAKGDQLRITTNPSFTDAGTYDNNDFAADILTSEGSSNLANYNLSISGKSQAMKIAKRSLSLQLAPQGKKYDGTPISATLDPSAERYHIVTGTLAENEYLSFAYLNDPVNKGVYPIESEVTVYHQVGATPDQGKDKVVTGNYELSIVKDNYTIDARALIITTLDTTHVYDRVSELEKTTSFYAVSGDGLAKGQKISALDIRCEGINVGSYPYVIDKSSLKISDATDNDVTSNYSVTFVNTGMRTITPRDFKVTMLDEEKTYSGKAMEFSKHQATNLLSGDYLTFSGLTSLTHVSEGTKANLPTSVSVFTSAGSDVTSNYHLASLVGSSVHVIPRKITLTSQSVIKTFDGYPIGNTTVEVGSTPLAEGDTLTISALASLSATNVSDSGPNSFTFAITNANGEHVESDYDVTSVYGTLTIYPTPLSVKTASTSREYDGNNNAVSVDTPSVSTSSYPAYLTAGESLPDTYNLELMLIPNFVAYTVGSYSDWTYTFQITSTRDPNIRSDNFLLSVDFGEYVVTAREITIQSLGGSKRYEQGESFPTTTWISSGSLAEGDTITYGAVTPLSERCSNAPNPIGAVTITNKRGDVVTSSYNIKYIYGQVSIY